MDSMSSTDQPDLTGSRRHFLKRSVGLGLCVSSGSVAGLSGMSQAHAVVSDNDKKIIPAKRLDQLNHSASRRLHVVNAHTWEDLNVVYYTHGIHIDENIEQLNHLMRDRRANVARAMDTKLYDQLYMLTQVLGTNEPVHVLSGYRTPETNARLRRCSSGVAKYSLHMIGKAADIFFPGVSVKQLQGAALAMEAGGVGLYSKSNFVHVDTGQIRNWGR